MCVRAFACESSVRLRCVFWVFGSGCLFGVIMSTAANHRTALADKVSQKKKAAKEVGWSGWRSPSFCFSWCGGEQMSVFLLL